MESIGTAREMGIPQKYLAFQITATYLQEQGIPEICFEAANTNCIYLLGRLMDQ
jgi:hypothetical protein